MSFTRMRPEVLVVGEDEPGGARVLTGDQLGVAAHTTIHGNSVLDAPIDSKRLGAENLRYCWHQCANPSHGSRFGVHLELRREPNSVERRDRLK
jgi:hypothetical protein